MEKLLNKKVYKLFSSIVLLFGLLTIANAASAKVVLSSYRYDYNIYTKSTMNAHGHRYINVPNHARFIGTRTVAVYRGWNFVRYQVNYVYRW